MKAVYSVTNGGRALNAVWECESLTSSQSLIMLFLGSQLDFRGDFTEFRYCSIERIAAATKLSQRQIFYHLKDLIERGYLLKQNRFQGGRQLASAYAMTEKVFDEYAAKLHKRAEMGENSHATIAGGGVQPLQAGGATIADRVPSGAPADVVPLNKKHAPPKGGGGCDKFIGKYIDLWKAHYRELGEEPVMNGQARGKAVRIVKAVGLERALDLLDVFFTMNDKFVKETAHNLSAMESCLSKLKLIQASRSQRLRPAAEPLLQVVVDPRQEAFERWWQALEDEERRKIQIMDPDVIGPKRYFLAKVYSGEFS